MGTVTAFPSAVIGPESVVSESMLLHLCEQRPGRVLQLIRAAQAREDQAEAVRMYRALLASRSITAAIRSAVRAQTYRQATHDLDELIDGAHLAILEQLSRKTPTAQSLEQFRAWVATIARRYVMSVTRLKREQQRRYVVSIDGTPNEPGPQAMGTSAPSVEDVLAGDWAVVKDALAAANQFEKTVILSRLVAERSPAETVAIVATQHGRSISEQAVGRIVESFTTSCRVATARS